MKSRRSFNICTMLLGGMVLLSCIGCWAIRASDEPWANYADPMNCAPLKERLPSELVHDLYDDACLDLENSKSFIANFRFNRVGEDLPVRVVIAAGGEPVDRVVVELIGGPGNAIMNLPSIESWTESSLTFAERCNAAILTPLYSGTWHRSLYPASSEGLATDEIADLVDSLQDSGLKVHLVGESLGARLLANPKVTIPSGEHLLFLPMLKSPEAISEWYDSGTAIGKERRNARSKNYYIGPIEDRTKKFVNELRFIESFFDSADGVERKNFSHLWAEKLKLNSGASTRAIIARNDKRAGGQEYMPELDALGIDVELIAGGHDPDGEEQASERFEAAASFLEDICES